MKRLIIARSSLEEGTSSETFNESNWEWSMLSWGIFIVARDLPCLRLGYTWHRIRSFQVDDIDANLKYEEENQ